ncbi:hypothetical protein A5622_07730 [Mycobacterium sp. 1245801.1]|nr:hypothetical protein A5622_07730 [Mycobacterium sp. 1245801.1]
MDPYRIQNLRRVREHWDDSPWPVRVVDDGEPGQFNRSRAYNRAANLVDADVLVYAEADLIIDYDQVDAAIMLAQTQPGLVIPFSKFMEINETQSALVRAGLLRPQNANAVQINGDRKSTGAVNVISRATLAQIGCYDEQFRGAWWDDTAMQRAFEICCGPIRFVDGPAYHLYHATGARRDAKSTDADRAATDANRRRYQLYERATTPAQIRALTTGSASA